MEVKVGHPVILTDAKGLKKHGLHRGMKGFANNVINMGDEGSYVFFMPDDIRNSFVIELSRVEVDVERLEETEGYRD